MTDSSDKIEFPKPNLVLEQATLKKIGFVQGTEDNEGEEKEPPAVDITLRIPFDRAVHYLGALARAWKNKRGITAGLVFAEQLALVDAAHSNGKGDVPKTGLEPIAGERPSERATREAADEINGGGGRKSRKREKART